MRPRELTLEGFKSYRGKQTFDFRGRRLVGVVGPIGAGKSSILDGISYSLFGKTPAVERDTKSLIHQLLDQCHVRLVFEVDGQIWRATRALRRKGQSGHTLELLTSDDPEAQAIETVTGEGPVRSRIAQLLGMDFAAFGRSVLLAQNRFAQFLKATPTERDRVLKGVFGYERLDEALRVAKGRLDRADLTLEGLRERANEVQVAKEQIASAQQDAADAAGRLEALMQADADVRRLREERSAAAVIMREVDLQVDHLANVLDALPTDTEIDDIVEAADTAEERWTGLEMTLEGALAAEVAARAAYEETVGRVGDARHLRGLETLVSRYEAETTDIKRKEAHLLELTGEVEAREAEAGERARIAVEATAAVGELESAAEQAVASTVEARGALDDAKHTEMAHHLRGDLVVGEPCPVCEQPVSRRPKKGAAPMVATAERALAKAEAKQKRASDLLSSARSEAAAAHRGVEAARTAVAQSITGREKASTEYDAAISALASSRTELAERLGEGDEPRDLLEGRLKELEEAEAATRVATAAVADARTELETERAARDGMREALRTLAGRLAGAWGRLSESRDVAATGEALRASRAEVATEVAARKVALRDRRAEAEKQAAVAKEELDAALLLVGLQPGDDFPAALREATEDHTLKRVRVDGLERAIAGAKELEDELVAATRDRNLVDRLAKDLQPSRFLAFLLGEERAELAELGSVHLQRLTDDAYLFTDDDRFDILDMNAAGKSRKADSLSGGETFLASLALALALSEMVARGGGRLDSFFLDEGFGGLDPEHLGRAMEGIGRLVSEQEDRFVVLVSHVEQMRYEIEDLIVLDVDRSTGDSLVVSGAMPPNV
jgi:DNA repair protein SbcC/Rad50